MEILLDAVMAIATGVALWTFLPRGVVLTRTSRTRDWKDQPLHDTWEIRNNSPLPVLLLSVRVTGVSTYDVKKNRIEEVDLPVAESDESLGVTLAFDDATLDTGRVEGRANNQHSWKGLVVPPGDTLQATVGTNTMLSIKYRRKGYCGIFERREICIHGYA